jgi:uncharacterized membrane protein
MGWSDERVELIIAYLLRAGAILSAALVLAGGVVYLLNHGGGQPDRAAFHGEPASLRSVGGIAGGAAGGDPRAIIQLGLLVLIATPVARVAFSVFAFLRQRDLLYVGVTLIVLALLTYSLAVGRA